MNEVIIGRWHSVERLVMPPCTHTSPWGPFTLSLVMQESVGPACGKSSSASPSPLLVFAGLLIACGSFRDENPGSMTPPLGATEVGRPPSTSEVTGSATIVVCVWLDTPPREDLRPRPDSCGEEAR